MYDKDGLLMKAANEENTLEFIRDKKTGRITEEHQNGYTVSHTYDKEGNRLHTTSNLGADIRHTYDKQGDLEAMQAGFVASGQHRSGVATRAYGRCNDADHTRPFRA